MAWEHGIKSMWGVCYHGRYKLLPSHAHMVPPNDIARLFNESLPAYEDSVEFYERMIPLPRYGAQVPDNQERWMRDHGIALGDGDGAYTRMYQTEMGPYDCYDMMCDLGQVYFANAMDLHGLMYHYERDDSPYGDFVVCMANIDAAQLELWRVHSNGIWVLIAEEDFDRRHDIHASSKSPRYMFGTPDAIANRVVI